MHLTCAPLASGVVKAVAEMRGHWALGTDCTSIALQQFRQYRAEVALLLGCRVNVAGLRQPAGSGLHKPPSAIRPHSHGFPVVHAGNPSPPQRTEAPENGLHWTCRGAQMVVTHSVTLTEQMLDDECQANNRRCMQRVFFTAVRMQRIT
jgi:hypothetical protein